MSKPDNRSNHYLRQVSSLLLYSSVLKDKVGFAYLNLLQNLSLLVSEVDRNDRNRNEVLELDCLLAYGKWFKALAKTKQSWQDYLIERILCDSNPFSQQIQTTSVVELPDSLQDAAKHDLKILQSIHDLSGHQVAQLVQNNLSTSAEPILTWSMPSVNNTCLHNNPNWQAALNDLADHYQQKGTGIFARYSAFRWQDNQLKGIRQPDPIKLENIVGFESQKADLVKNTQFLLAGYPALHVLLYGSRGTGKSSLVKALLTNYAIQGLRLIEVNKSELGNLPVIVEQLADVPQKFIIFVDDLSFEEDNDAFKSLKVVLEGSLTAQSQNIVVYATTNRRHLIREYFSDRPRPSDSDEIHNWDTVQEKLSFSDRFGLTLTFEPINQDTYLTIIHHLAQQAQIDIPQSDLDFRAKRWATRKNGRSGRTAQQFISFLRAEISLKETSGFS